MNALLCPFCRSFIGPPVAGTVRCAADGNGYTVLFLRGQSAPPTAPQLQDDLYRVAPAESPPLHAPVPAYAPAPLLVDCPQHPGVKASYLCAKCRAPICTTCMFSFPGGLQLCPNCASAPPALTPTQRRNGIWSAVLAGVTPFVLAAMFAISILAARHREKEAESLAGFVFLAALVLAILGLTLGLTARQRGVPTPWYIWVGVIGNGIWLGLLVLLTLIGLLAGGH